MAEEFDSDSIEPTTDEQAAEAEQPVGTQPEQRPMAQAVPARKAGLIGRWIESVNQFFSRITLPEWTLRTFLYLLVALIILVLLARNWTLVRIDLFGWHFDAPKPVVFAVSLALGAVLLRLWQVYVGRRGVEEPTEPKSSAGS